jgi:uncharacterized protein (TIGR00106 family)
MIAEFSIVPLGVGESLSKSVAEIIRIVDESGLTYRTNPMGTVLEGDWAAVMDVIKRCHDAALETAPRVTSRINIDIRPSKTEARMESKLDAIESVLNRKIKR